MGELVTNSGVLYVSPYPPITAADKRLSVAMATGSGNVKTVLFSCGSVETILIRNIHLEIAGSSAAERAWCAITVDRNGVTSVRLCMLYSRTNAQAIYQSPAHVQLENGETINLEYNNADTAVVPMTVHIIAESYLL